MLSDVDDDEEEEEEPPPPSAVMRVLKSQSAPAVPSAAFSSKLSFECAFASSAGAAYVAAVVVTALTDEEEKDGTSFLLLVLARAPNRISVVSKPAGATPAGATTCRPGQGNAAGAM